MPIEPRGLLRRAWGGVLAAALALPAPAMARLPLADHLVVHKARRELVIYVGGAVWRVLTGIQLGPNPVGAKHFGGDGRTPEGQYRIDGDNSGSFYHLGLHISYPNAADAAYARQHGRKPGGAIFLHGQPEDYRTGPAEPRAPGDWTAGCIALTDAEIELLWQVVPTGTPIEITP